MAFDDRDRSTAVDIRRVGDVALGVEWKDGVSSVIELWKIRVSCGCAVCCNEITGEPLLNPDTVPRDITAKRISPVGNYAITFEWSDGHDTGIYPWELIRELAD